MQKHKNKWQLTMKAFEKPKKVKRKKFFNLKKDVASQED